jgi:hypothetical protein
MTGSIAPKTRKITSFSSVVNLLDTERGIRHDLAIGARDTISNSVAAFRGHHNWHSRAPYRDDKLSKERKA